jgi:hypothetical protein
VGGHWQARGLRLWSDTRPHPGRRRSVADGLRRASGFGAETQLLQVRKRVAYGQRSALAQIVEVHTLEVLCVCSTDAAVCLQAF